MIYLMYFVCLLSMTKQVGVLCGRCAAKRTCGVLSFCLLCAVIIADILFLCGTGRHFISG